MGRRLWRGPIREGDWKGPIHRLNTKTDQKGSRGEGQSEQKRMSKNRHTIYKNIVYTICLQFGKLMLFNKKSRATARPPTTKPWLTQRRKTAGCANWGLYS